MAAKLGENMQREWDEEPLATELWEALQMRKADCVAGSAMLTSLADRGSTLAMMYLGQACLKSGDYNQAIQGEKLLRSSAENSSVEGRFQLACHYQ